MIDERTLLDGWHPDSHVDTGPSGIDLPLDAIRRMVLWWRHLGTTDMSNLVPLCVLHHHAVHERGWTLELDADRTLTTTRSDGTRRVGTIARRWPA